MKADEHVLDRLREALVDIDEVEEKNMFGGVCFMVKGKMCICVRDKQLMCRVGPEQYNECLEMIGCEPMIHGKKMMKGYVFVHEEGYQQQSDFNWWIDLVLAYNARLQGSS